MTKPIPNKLVKGPTTIHNELVLGQAGPNKRSIRKEVNICSSSIIFILTPGSYLTERQ